MAPSFPTTRAVIRKALDVLMAVSPLSIGIRLFILLYTAHLHNSWLIMPVWPNIIDAVLLAISGLYWLVRTAVSVWRDWWR